VLFSVTFTHLSQSATVINSGNVSGTWTLSNSPYKINGDITIADAQTLTIQAGVKVEFQGHYKLDVQGRLLALGNKSNFIEFTAADTSTGWSGIRFNYTPQTNDSSKIIFCKISYGKAISGTFYDKNGGAIVAVNFSKLLIQNCVISNNQSAYYGGAISCYYNSSPVISNNVICNNSSGYSGGAIYTYYYSNAIIIGNTIVNNLSNSYGGGISNAGSYPIIRNTIIWGNDGSNYDNLYSSVTLTTVNYSNIEGGYSGSSNLNVNPDFQSPSTGVGLNYNGLTADWSLKSTSPVINKGSRSTFRNYIPIYELNGFIREDLDTLDIGAYERPQSTVVTGNISSNTTWSGYVLVRNNISVDLSKTLTILPGTKVRFDGNRKIDVKGDMQAIGKSDSMILFTPISKTVGWGGVRYNSTSAVNDTSRFRFCHFEYANNYGKAYPDNYGGAFFIYNFSKIVIENSIINNNYAYYGGGLYIFNTNNGVRINGNLIINNESYSYGGGLYLYYSDLGFSNNTVSNNKTTYSASGYGSGMTILYGLPTIRNSIIYHNQGVSGIANIYPLSLTASAVEYSCVEGGFSGTGNISSNPLFNYIPVADGYLAEGIAGYDWTLADASPCIDAGTGSTSGLNLLATDLLDKQRVYNGRIDIGTFETKSYITVCGTISSNTLWDANKIKINCNVTINNKVTVTINPGTVVEFQGPYQISVKGRVLAAGTANRKILFTSLDTVTGWKGIRFENTPVINDTSIFSHCDFEFGNNAYTYAYGGAMYANNFDKIKLDNCEFRKNKSDQGGAIYMTYSDMIIRNSRFIDNYSTSYGGAIEAFYCAPTIEYSTFHSNESNSFGGALELWYCSNANFRNNKLTNNISNSGGALSIYQAAIDANFSNNIIANNTAYTGGAIFASNSPAILNNNTIVNNLGTVGGAMYLSNNTDFEIKNCIIYNNYASNGSQLYIADLASDPKISYSLIDGDTSSFDGYGAHSNYTGLYENNYDFDPLFIMPSDSQGGLYDGFIADWSYQQGSLAINSGTIDTTGLNLPKNDILGLGRVHNGRIDLGAIESHDDIVVCGDIEQNTIWSADTIKVECDIFIKNGVTLTITAGTVVEFLDYVGMDVEGRLLVEGTPQKKVSFIRTDTTDFYISNSFDGGWAGIQFGNIKSQNDTSIISNAIFRFCKTTSFGSAIYVYNSSKVVVRNTVFTNNLSGYGAGAVYIESADPVFINNLFYNNSADFYGGAMYLKDAQPILHNNTFANNKAQFGGGIYMYWSSPSIKNSIFYGNKLNSNTLNGSQVYLIYNSKPSFYNCDIEGGKTNIYNNSSIISYVNNIASDPEFVSPSSVAGAFGSTSYEGWAIRSSSPCINSGYKGIISSYFPNYDLNGNERMIADTADIGCFENQISERFIKQQPVSVDACEGTSVSFTTSMSISADFQWRKNGQNINNATSSTLVLSNITLADTGYYSCAISNSHGTVYTDNALLSTLTAPTIVTDPTMSPKCIGESATFSIDANGSNPISYQWYNSNGVISGATNSSYTIKSAGLNDASIYYCVATNQCSSVTSNGASLVIKTLPELSFLIPSSSICETDFHQFLVNSIGSTPITYQWFKSGQAISGATQTNYSITSATASDAGYYYCKATNSCGSDSTNISVLTINTKPTIVSHPTTTTACEQTSTTFSVTANGSPTLKYQWFKNNVAINGASNNSYTINSLSTADAGTYYCYVSNTCDSIQSNVATLTVNTIPAVTSQTSSTSRCSGQSMTFDVTATGSAPLTYQWYKDNASISGATSSSYTLNTVASSDAGNYYCIVSNPCANKSTSVIVLSIDQAPTLSNQTGNSKVCEGQTMSFNVTASGTPPISYQWYKDNAIISGATNYLLNFNSTTTNDAGDYHCIVSNTCGSIQSYTSSLTVNEAPVITSQSGNEVRCEDQSVTFSISSSGSSPITYQWFKNGAAISNATNSTYTVSVVKPADATNYYCSATNSCGSAFSSPVVLTVNTKPVVVTSFDSITLCKGEDVILNVTASGAMPVTYQWYQDLNKIKDATNSSHLLSSVKTANEGKYLCEATNVCGTTNSSFIQLNVNSPITIVNETGSQEKCEGEEALFEVNVTGEQPITYQWFNTMGAINGETSNSLYFSSVEEMDNEEYYCEITNSCGPVRSMKMDLTVNKNPVVTLGNDTTFCEGGSIMLSAGFGYFCQWNNGSLNPQIDVTKEGEYYVHVVDMNGCQSYSDTVNVNVLKPFDGEEICVVTNDPLSGHNLIAWQRTKGQRTAYYKIYRETTSAGIYELIGLSPFDSLGVFVDSRSIPRQKAYRYAISVVDSCGNESVKSIAHKTVHLSVNKGVGGSINLIWSHYEGLSFGTYNIYRGNHPDSLELLGSIQSNLNSYTDFNPPSGVAYYQVTAVKYDTCYLDVFRAQANKGP
ncbi:immunoglobulin domain-containing protein, partial [Bacteroidota bacterium]